MPENSAIEFSTRAFGRPGTPPVDRRALVRLQNSVVMQPRADPGLLDVESGPLTRKLGRQWLEYTDVLYLPSD